MDLGLNQKVAIVCAASKGLGRASAMALAREGVNVVVCARNEQALNEAASIIRAESGSRVLPVVCDLTREGDIERLVEKGVEEFGTVDILVTNVGHPQMGTFSDLTDVDWQHGYEGVLLPVIRLCRLVLPHMQQVHWGRIVHITSIAVREPGTPYLISSVFRAGVAALSKSLANELGHSGILVNTVCPGPFRTPLGEELIQRQRQRRIEPMQKLNQKRLKPPLSVGWVRRRSWLRLSPFYAANRLGTSQDRLCQWMGERHVGYYERLVLRQITERSTTD